MPPLLRFSKDLLPELDRPGRFVETKFPRKGVQGVELPLRSFFGPAFLGEKGKGKGKDEEKEKLLVSFHVGLGSKYRKGFIPSLHSFYGFRSGGGKG